MPLQSLRTEVARATTIAASVKTLINGFAKRIEDAKQNPAELQALADEMRATNDGLQADVEANTPAANA